jgi:hypothetical protein
MDRKMNLFGFCRWSLAALPVFLALMACDQLVPPSGGNGVDIPVKIRAVSIAGGAQNKTVTRASGQKRIVGEPIVQDLGNGMLAEITVEEDLSALRATPLTKDVKLRIVALIKNSSTIYSWADYTATNSGAFTRTSSADLHVIENTDYDFVCFSYNSTTASLPDPLSEGSTLGSITVTNANDFLYKKWTTNLSTTSNTLSFTLEQQLAKVTLILNGGSRTITNVAENSIKITSVSTPTTHNLTATTSALSGTTAGDVFFTGWGSSSTPWEKSLRLVPTSSESTLRLPAEAITVGSLKSEEKDIQLPVLGVGSSCRVTITLKEVSTSKKFAGSNIYWDGSKLTFVPYNESNTTPYPETYYQGVYFKWGSLIGISPVGAFSSGTATGGVPGSATIDGTPIYLKNPSGNWVKTNVAYATSEDKSNGKERWFGDNSVSDNTTGTHGAWSPIPYGSTDGPYGTDKYTLLTNHSDFAGYRGDICNYINPAYRMPTSDELGNLSYVTKMTSTSTFNVPAGDDNAAGKYIFDKTSNKTIYGTFTTTVPTGSYVLPSSGFRSNDAGTLGYVGRSGYYWSGSASSSNAYGFVFDSSSANADINAYRTSAILVRCVLQE